MSPVARSTFMPIVVPVQVLFVASNWRRDVTSSNFDLWGHRACRWCVLPYSIRIPSLKVVCLPVPKIWLIFGHSVTRLGDLDHRFLTLELVRNVSRGMDNRRANFDVSATFCCRVMGKHESDWWQYHYYYLDLLSFRSPRWSIMRVNHV